MSKKSQPENTEHDPETGEVLPEGQFSDAEPLEVSEFEAGTLAGELRDAMLTRFRDMQKPWAQMSEDEQREFSEGINFAARSLVRGAVRAVTKFEWPRCIVHLGEIKIVGGEKARIEGKVVASNFEENRNVLGDHVNTDVLLICVDSDSFMGERDPVQIDPDQPELPTEDQEAA